jgi:hypothetical protein
MNRKVEEIDLSCLTIPELIELLHNLTHEIEDRFMEIAE